MSGLRVAVDARPLDVEYLRAQGIGRYAHGLLGPLGEVAAERGGELVLLRERRPTPAAFATAGQPRATTVRLRRPPVPLRAADLPEQLLLPLDLRRTRASLHHALSIYRAAVFPGLPFVMTMHDVVPLMWPEEYLRTGFVHRMLYRAARRARLLLAVSETARADVIEHIGVDPDKVLLVPEAADARFVPADPAPARERLGIEGPYLLWVGGLASRDPRKNLERLVDGFGDWQRAEGRHETLVLAGQAGDTSRALTERAGARVVFPGFVSDELLPSLYSGASCFLTASRYEGFGLPALEAVSCGTPVVAFDAGAVPEVAGPGALTVPAGDLSALLRAAGTVCDEPELRDRLAAAGLDHSSRYSWRRTAELTWDAYELAAAT